MWERHARKPLKNSPFLFWSSFAYFPFHANGTKAIDMEWVGLSLTTLSQQGFKGSQDLNGLDGRAALCARHPRKHTRKRFHWWWYDWYDLRPHFQSNKPNQTPPRSTLAPLGWQRQQWYFSRWYMGTGSSSQFVMSGDFTKLLFVLCACTKQVFV